jgi:hypothetical protein
MDKDKDLLPWIFGGLSIATVAIAMTVGSSNGTAPTQSQVPGQTIAHMLPEVAAVTSPPVVTTAQPETTTAPAPTMVTVQIQPATAPMAHSQIWECTINGQKTFSDNPCGDKASVHEVGPINGMDPTPIRPNVRSNVPEPSYQAAYQGGQEDSYPDEQRFSNNPYSVVPYPVFIGIPFHEHGRFEHEHRPRGHLDGPPMLDRQPMPHAPPVPHAPSVPRRN